MFAFISQAATLKSKGGTLADFSFTVVLKISWYFSTKILSRHQDWALDVNRWIPLGLLRKDISDISFLSCLVVFLCFKNFGYVHSLRNLLYCVLIWFINIDCFEDRIWAGVSESEHTSHRCLKVSKWDCWKFNKIYFLMIVNPIITSVQISGLIRALI